MKAAFTFCLTMLATGLETVACGWCLNNTADCTLAFQTPYSGISIQVALLEGYRLLLECCATAATSIKWTVNGLPIEFYGSKFSLEEKAQVLQSEPAPPSGLYVCVASNEVASISKSFAVRTLRSDDSCRLGVVGEVQRPAKSEGDYVTQLGLTVQLNCTAVLRCGSPSLVNRVQWWKINPDSEGYWNYLLYEGQEMDASTGDSVSVSSSFTNSPRKMLQVNSILTIKNVDLDDLYIEEPFPPNCGGEKGPKCFVQKSTNYFACTVVLEDSDDPSQANYSLQNSVKLHPRGLFSSGPGQKNWPRIGSRKSRSTGESRALRLLQDVPSATYDAVVTGVAADVALDDDRSTSARHVVSEQGMTTSIGALRADAISVAHAFSGAPPGARPSLMLLYWVICFSCRTI